MEQHLVGWRANPARRLFSRFGILFVNANEQEKTGKESRKKKPTRAARRNERPVLGSALVDAEERPGVHARRRPRAREAAIEKIK